MRPSSLAPSFLLSMPQLMDPNFSRTVVLLCKHSEEGAFGLVINRPLLTSGTVTVNLDPPVSTDRELQIWVGGPVEPYRSWILVGQEPDEAEDLRGMRVAENLYLSTSPDLLRRLLEPSPPPMARAGAAAGPATSRDTDCPRRACRAGLRPRQAPAPRESSFGTARPVRRPRSAARDRSTRADRD